MVHFLMKYVVVARVLLTFDCSFMHMRSGMTCWALKLDLGVVVHGR